MKILYIIKVHCVIFITDTQLFFIEIRAEEKSGMQEKYDLMRVIKDEIVL